MIRLRDRELMVKRSGLERCLLRLSPVIVPDFATGRSGSAGMPELVHASETLKAGLMT